MRVIAITGDIASGKTTVARFLVKLGEVVFDTDEIGHEIDQKTPQERRDLAKKVLADEDLRQALNQQLWPKIKAVLNEKIALEYAKKTPLVFVQVPRLFETDWLEQFDEILLISADEKLRRQRLKERALSPEEIKVRLKLLFDRKNIAVSTKTPLTKLENNGSMRQLEDSVEKYVAKQKDLRSLLLF